MTSVECCCKSINTPVDLVKMMFKNDDVFDFDPHEITLQQFGKKKRKEFQTVVDKIKSKLTIDPKRPTYDLVVTYVGYDANFNRIDKQDVIKWQPPLEDFAAWDNLEINLVNADIGQATDEFHLVFPKDPYRWGDEFFRAFDIDSSISKMIFRVEIVVAKDLLSFIVIDNNSFKNQVQAVWSYMSHMYRGNGTKELFLETKTDFQDLADKLKKNPYVCCRQRLLQHCGERVLGSSFASPYLALAFDRESPIVEKLEIDKAKKQDEKDANLDF